MEYIIIGIKPDYLNFAAKLEKNILFIDKNRQLFKKNAKKLE